MLLMVSERKIMAAEMPIELSKKRGNLLFWNTER